MHQQDIYIKQEPNFVGSQNTEARSAYLNKVFFALGVQNITMTTLFMTFYTLTGGASSFGNTLGLLSLIFVLLVFGPILALVFFSNLRRQYPLNYILYGAAIFLRGVWGGCVLNKAQFPFYLIMYLAVDVAVVSLGISIYVTKTDPNNKDGLKFVSLGLTCVGVIIFLFSSVNIFGLLLFFVVGLIFGWIYIFVARMVLEENGSILSEEEFVNVTFSIWVRSAFFIITLIWMNFFRRPRREEVNNFY